MDRITGTREVKLIAIGNSKGIRLPKALLEKYGWSDTLVLQEVEEGVVLHGRASDKLSWHDTGRAMAAEREDWNELEVAVADGLD